MSWKNPQTSLGQLFIQHNKAIEIFDDIDALVNWCEIEKCLSHIYNKKVGNVAYPPLMMFKALLLQAWHKLSDEMLESALARDLAFRRFVGLDLSDLVPDHSTIWRFREKLQDGMWEQLLDLVNNNLAKQSLFIKTGNISIIDASVIEAKNCRPRRGKSGDNTQDSEASLSVKMNSKGVQECVYGFKAHVNVEEDGMVQKVILSTGSEHDSRYLEPLLTGGEVACYADKAYKSKKHDEILDKKQIKNGIMFKAYRNKPLTKEQKQQNKNFSKIRYIVERTFGLLELRCGFGKARYNGLVRTAVSIGLMCMMNNLKRGVTIARELLKLEESCA